MIFWLLLSRYQLLGGGKYSPPSPCWVRMAEMRGAWLSNLHDLLAALIQVSAVRWGEVMKGTGTEVEQPLMNYDHAPIELYLYHQYLTNNKSSLQFSVTVP